MRDVCRAIKPTSFRKDQLRFCVVFQYWLTIDQIGDSVLAQRTPLIVFNDLGVVIGFVRYSESILCFLASPQLILAV